MFFSSRNSWAQDDESVKVFREEGRKLTDLAPTILLEPHFVGFYCPEEADSKKVRINNIASNIWETRTLLISAR